jgi:hypothetical protein
MSMGTHVIGFRPPDEKYKKMLKAYQACVDAGIVTPREVDDFFNNLTPDPNGIEVELNKAVTAWTDGDMCQGYEVDVTKLPKDVKIIRFYNSY